MATVKTLSKGQIVIPEVVQLLEEIQKTGAVKYLNAINLGEIIYTTKKDFGDQKKLEVLASIERLNFRILPIPNELIFQASEYKAEFSISYADCFALPPPWNIKLSS